jgi:hypothetical protein
MLLRNRNKLRRIILIFVFGLPLLFSAIPAADLSSSNSCCGPTLLLNRPHQEAPDNAVVDFMYFVALISPEPVSILQSPGNTQRTRLVSVTRRDSGKSFVVTCEFEFSGEGYQKDVFDLTNKIRRNEDRLRQGAVLDHLLKAISVEGSGALIVEVIATAVVGSPQVSEVRLHFNGRGRESPVTIDLEDIRYVAGSLRPQNEIQARVNTLTFRKQTGPPKMDITVATVRRIEAPDSAWETLKSRVKATAVNWVMDPVAVDAVGNETMLRFGLALASDAPDFTFPRARNLK